MKIKFTLYSLFLIGLCFNSLSQTNKFDQLLEDFHEEGLQLSPFVATLNTGDSRNNDKFELDISDQYRDDFVSYYQKYKNALEGIKRSELSADQQVSYDILLWECDINIEGGKYPTHLVPLNQLWCLPIIVGQQASGQGAVPFKTAEDYDNWLKRLDGFVSWIELAIERMKEGIQSGHTLPKPLTEKVIPQYASLAAGKPTDHLYYSPVKNIPEEIDKNEAKRIENAYSTKVENDVIPAFKKLHSFLQDEYLPSSRTSHGISSTPNGLDYYNYLIKVQTTTTLKADEIHKIGLSEVARIRGEMMKVKDQVGFKGSLIEFFDHVRNNTDLMPFKNPEEVLNNFNLIYQKIKPRVAELFDLEINIPFEIKRVEAFREASASVHYVAGAADASRPGIFYVPIPDATKYNTFSDESLFLHEAIPGHHFQASVALENTGVPTFRKFVWYGAHGEGWGLYCESLGKELGLFSDPYQYFGMLSMEMHRAIRLVVDTGIHTKGWTRERAIKYSLENEAVAEATIISEVERYMAWPAQALSYKVGQLKIQELRTKAEKQLGSRFDIKGFHTTIIESGGLPLKILEEKINSWIELNN